MNTLSSVADTDIHGTRYEISQMQYIDNGNILISGKSAVEGILLEIDTEGNMQWYGHYLPFPWEENFGWHTTEINHVTQTSDGGFLCTGQYMCPTCTMFPQGIQTAFALKVDEFGCLEPGCQVGINQLEAKQNNLSIYPNPSKGRFIVGLPENETSTVRLFNSIGEVILSEINVRGSKYNIDLTEMANGIYLINLQTKSGSIYSSKIIIE